MAETILITGASGLVGKPLVKALTEMGYHVRTLGRRAEVGNKTTFVWNYALEYLDEEALEGVDYIVHLAGAGVADERWSPARRKQITESRVKTAELLLRTLKKRNQTIKGFVSASGTGYYGVDTGDAVCIETSDLGKGFLADVCRKWETAALQMQEVAGKVVILRTGVVLAEKGGALDKLAMPVRLGLGAPMGTGKQFMSWIHIDDLVKMYVYAVTHLPAGAYNAVAPAPVTNKEFTQTLAEVMNRPLFLPAVPAAVLQMSLGEMATIITGGNRVSAEKVLAQGFQFEYSELKDALFSLVH